MRSTRIYHPQEMQVGEIVRLNPEASHHLSVVLRFNQGEELTLFDGQGHEYQVLLHAVHKKYVEVLVQTKLAISRESNLKIHVAQGIAKGDHWLYSLQKAVELGVDEITPLWTQHVAFKWDKKVDQKKMAQWQAIMVSACEQSGRTSVPKLNPIVGFNDFVLNIKHDNRIILHPYGGKHWRELNLQPTGDVTVMIGPEGGFSEAEYAMALSHQVQGMTLGPRILRTETAVVSALTILQAQYGDL